MWPFPRNRLTATGTQQRLATPRLLRPSRVSVTACKDLPVSRSPLFLLPLGSVQHPHGSLSLSPTRLLCAHNGGFEQMLFFYFTFFKMIVFVYHVFFIPSWRTLFLYCQRSHRELFFFTFQISTRFNFLSILSVSLKGNGVYNEETCGRKQVSLIKIRQKIWFALRGQRKTTNVSFWCVWAACSVCLHLTIVYSRKENKIEENVRLQPPQTNTTQHQ